MIFGLTLVFLVVGATAFITSHLWSGVVENAISKLIQAHRTIDRLEKEKTFWQSRHKDLSQSLIHKLKGKNDA